MSGVTVITVMLSIMLSVQTVGILGWDPLM